MHTPTQTHPLLFSCTTGKKFSFLLLILLSAISNGRRVPSLLYFHFHAPAKPDQPIQNSEWANQTSKPNPIQAQILEIPTWNRNAIELKS